MIYIYGLAQTINDEVINQKLFDASYIVKKTIDVWKEKDNYELLCEEAQVMVALHLSKLPR
ncbi:MAG: hypothetical protein GY941_25540 [Planctomycetes bacterium]|nr:hypothetical protein [Planctomycetota bacterium]